MKNVVHTLANHKLNIWVFYYTTMLLLYTKYYEITFSQLVIHHHIIAVQVGLDKNKTEGLKVQIPACPIKHIIWNLLLLYK